MEAAMRRHAPPPLYISHRQEKFHFSDGRRGVRFYLVDNMGNATPAVLGQERDTKDGHYMYRKEDAFTRGLPDESKVVGNLAGVHRWLRDMMTNPSGAGAGGGHGGGGGGGGRAHAPAKRARGEGVVTHTVPMLKPLSAAAERRRLGKLSKKIGALAYVRDEPLEEAKQEVVWCCSVLQETAAAQAANGACPPQLFHGALEALRRLQQVYVNLPLLEETQASHTVALIARGPDKQLAQVASTVVQQWLGALLSHVQSLTETPPPPPAIVYKEVRVEAPEEAAERAQRRERAALDAAPLPPGGYQLPPSPRGARSGRPGRPAAVPAAPTIPELHQLPAPLVLLPPPPSLQLLSSPPHAHLPPRAIVALSSAGSRRVAHGGDGAGSVSQLLPAVNLLAPTPAVATPSIESLLVPQPCAPPASPQPLSNALPLSPAPTPLPAAVTPLQHTPQATVSLNSLVAAEEPQDSLFKYRDAPPAAMPTATATSPVPLDSPSPEHKEANRSHKAKLDKERAFVDSEGGAVLKNKTRSGGKLSSGGKEAPGVKPSPKKPTHPPLPIGASVLNKNGKKLGKGEALPKTPLGKGRKLCHVCGTVVGSPTRVCPHCHASLPFKTHQ